MVICAPGPYIFDNNGPGIPGSEYDGGGGRMKGPLSPRLPLGADWGLGRECSARLSGGWSMSSSESRRSRFGERKDLLLRCGGASRSDGGGESTGELEE